MGLFAFRRLREREAAATAAASFCVPKLEPMEPTDGNNNRRDNRRSKRQLIPNAGGRAVDS
jgi:hypothetical protein